MIEFIKNPKIDFMGKRKYAFVFSGLLMALGIFSLIQMWGGRANLGIDFAGGTEVQVKFSRPVSLGAVRSALDSVGLKDMEIQELPTLNKILVTEKGSEQSLGKVSDAIINTLKQKFAGASPVIDSTTEIGPKVGSRLRSDAIVASLFAAVGILIYIALRFRFQFSIGATIATFHDVLAVLGVFYLLGKEVNLIFISALLTIAGYSLTDTVVVFDRIRENLRTAVKEPIESVVNRSINEVLSRTLITSLTVIFCSLALLVFGGEVIHDFALAITLGVIVGTYSSWFVASPAVLLVSRGKILHHRR
ncbi:MAG: protein translocase subunit SecF [Nitrospiraceae bacterium]|nr:protein translocase subunit SecF [Nitrospiraceae bacterium]